MLLFSPGLCPGPRLGPAVHNRKCAASLAQGASTCAFPLFTGLCNSHRPLDGARFGPLRTRNRVWFSAINIILPYFGRSKWGPFPIPLKPDWAGRFVGDWIVKAFKCRIPGSCSLPSCHRITIVLQSVWCVLHAPKSHAPSSLVHPDEVAAAGQ